MYQFSNRSQMMSNCGMNKRREGEGEGEGTRGQAKCVPNVLPTV